MSLFVVRTFIFVKEIFLAKQFASQMRWASAGDGGDDLDVAEGPLLLQASGAEGARLWQEEEEEEEAGWC